MDLTGAPPSTQPIPGGELPVKLATHTTLHSKDLDCGDLQIAYYNIGLGSTNLHQNAQKPNLQQFDDYIRRLVWYTTRPPPDNHSARNYRKRRMATLFSAILTIRGIKLSRWPLDTIIDMDPMQEGAEAYVNWPRVPAPIPWSQMQPLLRAHKIGLKKRIERYDPLPGLFLSRAERAHNSLEKRTQLVRYWDAIPRHGGFQSQEKNGGHHIFTTLNWPEDGNSLWYCVFYAENLTQMLTDDFAACKVRVWKYFNYVIHHPSHARHRLYVHLERQSWTEIENHSPGTERLWGRMSILRALHLNTPNSGPPMYGNFQGMMQVIADYFHKEVILFIRKPGAQTVIGPSRVTYTHRVFGSLSDGKKNGQLFFVSDEVTGQYSVVTHMNERLLGARTGYAWNTTGHTSDDRYGWIGAPWMPPRPLPDGYELAPPDTYPNFVVYPWVVMGDSRHYRQFHACGNAIDDDSRYGKGAVPLLPDPVAAGWQTETLVMPHGQAYPEFPFAFSHRKIVTGVYEDANGREWWPQWNNIHAYKAHEYQTMAKLQGLPIEPHKLSKK